MITEKMKGLDVINSKAWSDPKMTDFMSFLHETLPFFYHFSKWEKNAIVLLINGHSEGAICQSSCKNIVVKRKSTPLMRWIGHTSLRELTLPSLPKSLFSHKA